MLFMLTTFVLGIVYKPSLCCCGIRSNQHEGSPEGFTKPNCGSKRTDIEVGNRSRGINERLGVEGF